MTPVEHEHAFDRTRGTQVAYGLAVNIAQQDRIAQRTKTCPRCGAEPGEPCWERARGDPFRKAYLARPHAERAELVQDEDGLGESQLPRCAVDVRPPHAVLSQGGAQLVEGLLTVLHVL